MALERTFKLTFLGDAKKAIGEMDKVEGKFGALGKAAKVAAAGAALAAVGVAAKWATEFESAYDTIRIGTGAVGDDLKGLEDSFKNVLKSVPEDMAVVSQVLADLNTRTGATGEDIESLTTTIINLARITGSDVNALVEETTRVFGDWSVATEDQIDVLDMLFKTSQATGVTVDDLTRNLVAYGAPLRSFNFSLEESSALLGQFERDGVNTELVMGSLRIAIGKFAKDGVPLRQGLEDIIEQIQELGPGAEATALAMETFGARAGADMAATILEGKFAIDEVMATISGNKDTIDGLADDALTLSQRFDRFQNRIKVALEPTLRKLFDILESGAKLLDKVPDSVLALTVVIGGLAIGVGVLVAALAPLAILFSPAGLIILGIAAVIAAGVLLWKNWDTVKEKAAELGGWIKDRLGDVLGWAADHWPEIATLIAGPFAPMVALATDAFGLRSALTNAFGEVLKVIIGVVGGAIHQIENLIEKIRELFGLAAELPGKVGDALNPLPGNAGGGLAGDLAQRGLEGAVPGLGAFNAARKLFGFDSGGIVPGPRGAPQMVMAHGGETILPTHRGGGFGGGLTVNVHFAGSSLAGEHEIERAVVRALNTARAKGGF